MPLFRWVGPLVALGWACAAASASADEKKIPVESAPRPVIAAFRARFPEASIKAVIEETEDGKTTYEVESVDQANMSIDCVLKPDGTIEAVERQIKPADLPEAVAATVARMHPQAAITRAEEVTEGAKVTYEVVVKPAEGKKRTLILARDGAFLEEEK